MALPSNNIGIMAVRNCIDYPSTDLGTLCVCTAVNKWSKHKPVSYNAISVDGIDNWWKADDGKCGLSVPVYTSVGYPTTANTFLWALINDATTWDRTPPRGGVTAPYRLGDFRYYSHDAVCPIANIGALIYFLPPNLTLQFDYDMVVDPGNFYNLSIADIVINGVNLSDFYLGCIIWQSATRYYLFTSPSKMGTTSFSIPVTLTNSYAGKWFIKPFACSAPIVNGNIPAATFVPIDLPRREIDIKAQGTLTYISVFGEWISNNAIRYNIVITNNNSSPLTVKGVTASLVRTTGAPETGEIMQSNNVGQTTVGANTTWTSGSYTISGLAYSKNYDYYFAGIADGLTTTYNQVGDYVPEN